MTPKLITDDQREFAITREVWTAWQEAARPFESPDDVLRRRFEVDDLEARTTAPQPQPQARRERRVSQPRRRGGGGKRTRAPSNVLLPETEYELPILRALSDAGGRRPTREVIEEVGRVLGDRLTDVDKKPMDDGGQVRWQNRVQFARLRLVKGGLMKSGSPRGVWEISPAGEKRLAESS